MLETIFGLLKEFSLFISLIIGLPLGYKIIKWLRSNFIFFGTPTGLISAFVAGILLPVAFINMTLEGGINIVEKNVIQMTKPKYVKYLELARESDDDMEKMEYIKKSLKKEYNTDALEYSKEVLISIAIDGEDYEKYFDIVKPEMKEEHINVIYMRIYEKLAYKEYYNKNYDVSLEYLEKAKKLGGKKNENDEDDIYVLLEEKQNEMDLSVYDKYKEKLDSIQEESDSLTHDGSTLEIASEIHKKWDDMLNEIYGLLKDKLPSEDFETLKVEQTQWLSDRDMVAEDSALEIYEDLDIDDEATLNLEYTETLATLTKERCYELIIRYMQ